MWTRREFAGALGGAAAARAGDEEGLPDFSNSGYRGGGVELPAAPVRMELRPESGDATARVQEALERMAALPREKRGALLLRKGTYEIGGVLRMRASGVVLRGEQGTVLFAAGKEPRALIEVKGTAGRLKGEGMKIADERVAVGSRAFRVVTSRGLKVGQRVVVRRVGNREWIHEIGMDRIQGRPGKEQETKQWAPFDLDFERVIVGIEGERVTVDAPVMCAIEARWGGGWVIPFEDGGRVSECGVEMLEGVSAFDRSVTAEWGRTKERYFADEAHARDLVLLDEANDCWVKGVKARHFTGSCVNVKTTRGVQVEDCDCEEMVSQITGGRRYPYSVSGQLTLVRRCTADTGRHDFVVGSRVKGPNVFLDCRSGRMFATSEPHHRWSVGGLYDNVKADIAIQDRQWMGTGHGWAGANYVVWNCEGELVCQKPPTANNWVVGHVGRKKKGAFEPREDGTWRSHGAHVQPRSLYEAQLGERARTRALVRL